MNTNTMPSIPDGYMQDAQGRLVPREMVKDIDIARDSLVNEIAERAVKLSVLLATFKEQSMADIQAFIDLSAERYGVNVGGVKGNANLGSFDGKYRIQRAIDEYLVFDERLQIAKQLIDECLHAWAKDSDAKIKVLINDAFQVDKRGRVNTKRIMSLRSLKIDDEQWKQAMDAISESIQVAGTKAYLRIYERQANGEYKQISLDVAA